MPLTEVYRPRYTGAVLLLTGPAGSGKTPFILNCLRQALRDGNHRVRLLVPTATLAQHLQNQIAREGFVLPCDLIQTLSAFVETWAGDPPQAPDTVVYLMVKKRRGACNVRNSRASPIPRELCVTIAKTINEFASAGCDSGRLAHHLPEAPLAEAFLADYQELDRMLEERGLSLRARRLERAGADGARGRGRHRRHLAGRLSCAARSGTARPERVGRACRVRTKDWQ